MGIAISGIASSHLTKKLDRLYWERIDLELLGNSTALEVVLHHQQVFRSAFRATFVRKPGPDTVAAIAQLNFRYLATMCAHLGMSQEDMLKAIKDADGLQATKERFREMA